MAELRAMLERLGHAEVRTLLNSGNVVFAAASRSTPGLSNAISATVLEHLGVATPVVVKSAAEFTAIVDGNPLAPAEPEHSRLLVAYSMDRSRLDDLAPLHALLRPGERLAITKCAAYLHCAGGILQSKAAAALVGKHGRGITTRNWGTTLKLAALLRAL